MSQSMLMLVVAGLAASTLLLAGLAVVIRRETQRSLAFDRRLFIPRRQAVSAGLWSERRERHGRGGGSSRAFALVLLRAASMLAPVGVAEREKLGKMIRHAGFAQRDALSVFLALKLASALAAGAAAGAWSSGSETIGQYGILVALVVLAGFVAGGVAPEYVLRAMIGRRSRRMAIALPDALDLMVMCLESGLAFERAVLTVAEELMPIEPNLAGELRQMEAELRVGSDRRTVLQEFQRRTEVEGLRDLAMTLIQAERYGTPLTQSMRNIAAAERTQRSARIEAQAERLPVLMMLPTLLLVTPGTMCLIAGPAFLSVARQLESLGVL